MILPVEQLTKFSYFWTKIRMKKFTDSDDSA